jgi:dihydropteroate synthase
MRTAARALALGMDVINDGTGLADTVMPELLCAQTCDVVAMHALSVPVDPTQTLPADCDVLQEIPHWKTTGAAKAVAAGLDPARLVYDPGIGFGKTAGQSLTLMHGAAVLVGSGGRWLFGHSRKSFIKVFTHADAAQRDDLTQAYSAQLANAGVHIVRVHAAGRPSLWLTAVSQASWSQGWFQAWIQGERVLSRRAPESLLIVAIFRRPFGLVALQGLTRCAPTTRENALRINNLEDLPGGQVCREMDP